MAYEAVAITAGSGTNIAVDTVSGQAIQVVKLDVGTDGATTPVSTAAPLPMRLEASTTGGCSTYHKVAAAGDNRITVKASPGQVYGVEIFNNAPYPVFVKLYNSAATPDPASGVVRTFGVQGGTGLSRAFPLGLKFTAGIGLCILKVGIADNTATGVVLNDCVVDLDWI